MHVRVYFVEDAGASSAASSFLKSTTACALEDSGGDCFSCGNSLGDGSLGEVAFGEAGAEEGAGDAAGDGRAEDEGGAGDGDADTGGLTVAVECAADGAAGGGDPETTGDGAALLVTGEVAGEAPAGSRWTSPALPISAPPRTAAGRASGGSDRSDPPAAPADLGDPAGEPKTAAAEGAGASGADPAPRCPAVGAS